MTSTRTPKIAVLRVLFSATLTIVVITAASAQETRTRQVSDVAFMATHDAHTASLDSQTPVPFITLPLVPDATPPGGSDFILTVNGTGFVSQSVVHWNGSPRATTFVNNSRVTAAIPAADIVKAGTASVTVVTPPPGGGTSNVAFFTAAINSARSVSFKLASSYAIGNPGPGPNSVAVGDFNGDASLDLVVTNWDRSSVSIFLGDGAGNFTVVSSPTVNPGPTGVAVGDFNRDGRLDVAVTSADLGGVTILLGDGTGNFTQVPSPDAGSMPFSVAVGDFDRDGTLDLAVANYGGPPSTASILLGDGTGNFTSASSPATGANPTSLAVGDFNGDGTLDLAVANSQESTVYSLLGDGTGNFVPTWSPAGTGGPYAVAAGDFNRDGRLDLAVADGLNTSSVLLGDGTGTFPLTSFVGGGTSYSVALGDFNGDDTLDMALTNLFSNTVSILLGDGQGQFSAASSPATGSVPTSIAVGDFNRDGRLDLVVVNWGDQDHTVSILLNNTPLCAVPPTITESVTPTTLWPPNGNMVEITVAGTIADTGCSVATAAYVVADEYGQVQPSGPVTVSPDGAFSLTLPLEASRLGADTDGRVYTVTVSATNSAGETASQSRTVVVPHDQRH